MLVGGLVAFGAYKMSKRDADRVEEHTGVPPEEMSDEELEQAMDDLGIEKQQRTAADEEQGAPQSGAEQQGGQRDAVDTEIEEIEKLAALHESGVLTDEEFSAKKREILGLD